MDKNIQQDQIERAIENLIRQIELLTNRCTLENNKSDKNYKFQDLIEASSVMLQLSRTLNELLVIQSLINSKSIGSNADSLIGSILSGRR